MLLIQSDNLLLLNVPPALSVVVGIGHVVGMTAGNEWMLCEELQVWIPPQV